jgi:putative tryptophan/tyrosine transport system substrate-binding protein
MSDQRDLSVRRRPRRADLAARLASGMAAVLLIVALSASHSVAQSVPPPLVGVLLGYRQADAESHENVEAFRAEMARLGWVGARAPRYEQRWTEGQVDRFRPLAAELVALRPAVILVQSNPGIAAVRAATSEIATVFVQVSDPAGGGFVASLPRPGGNVTGFANYEPVIAGKWLEILRQVAPEASSVTTLMHADTAAHRVYRQEIERLAPSIGLSARFVEIRDADLAETLSAIGAAQGQALLVLPHILARVHRGPIIAVAARERIPAVYPFRYFAQDGGLLSYGTDVSDQYRLAGGYVDRILKGAKPSDLPVQQPTKFDLVVNMATARAQGIAIPPAILSAASEILD